MSNLPEVLSDDLCLALSFAIVYPDRLVAFGIVFPITPKVYRQAKFP